MNIALRHGLLVLLVLTSQVVAQQPNSSQASQLVSGFGGPPYPIQVGGLQGSTVDVDLAGAASSPFLLAIGRVAAGSGVTSFGILDLDFTSPGFAVLFNGFDNTFPTFNQSFLDPQGAFGISFPYAVTSVIPAGTQAMIGDPTVAAGARLTAAADFAPNTPEPLLINLTGGSAPLWTNNGGTTGTPGACVTGAFLNNELTLHFGGSVDPASLPSAGPASGSINIFTSGALPGSVVPAVGVFTVRDDPRLPTPNGRIVAFLPQLPNGPGCTGAGLIPDSVYTVFVPGQGQGQVLTVGSQPLATGAFTCFRTQACNPATPEASFVDPSPGPAVVTGTIPAMGNPSPPAIPPASIAGNTVVVFFDELVLPGTVNTSTFRLVNQTTGSQVPGTVQVFTSGAGSVITQGPSRVEYTAFEPLTPSSIFRLEVDATVTDFFGNPAELIAGMPGMPLLFQTQTTTPTAQTPFVENFQNTNNAASVPGNMTWGGGSLTIAFSSVVAGTGAFGPMVFGPGNHTLDTGAPPVPGFANGVWNASVIDVQIGATVRVFGPHPAHLRSMGTITIDGTINASAGTTAGAPAPETGPSAGAFNNGQGIAPSVVAGGLGGPGAGRGGNASQGGTVRTERGEDGFGANINGMPNPGVPPTISYGGGQGGDGSFRFPSGGQMGELGGLGGAGGSAFTTGAIGGPYGMVGPNCVPQPSTVQPVAQATGSTVSFTPPISELSAGSGGGGGGDRHEVAGAMSDDQGGGGGGGGGGLRLSSLGDVNVNGSLLAAGAPGGNGNVFFGGFGGGGSGGLVWLQSLGQLNVSSSATIRVDGGTMGTNCVSGLGGQGGDGLIQLEDSDGTVNTGFNATPPSSVFVLGVVSPGNVGTATSTFFNTGSQLPTYQSATEVSNPGATGTVTIMYQGAHASVTDPNVPDLSTLSAPVPAAQISNLNGRRFIRFTALLTYPPFPATQPTTPLPSVQNVTINYATP